MTADDWERESKARDRAWAEREREWMEVDRRWEQRWTEERDRQRAEAAKFRETESELHQLLLDARAKYTSRVADNAVERTSLRRYGINILGIGIVLTWLIVTISMVVQSQYSWPVLVIISLITYLYLFWEGIIFLLRKKKINPSLHFSRLYSEGSSVEIDVEQISHRESWHRSFRWPLSCLDQ